MRMSSIVAATKPYRSSLLILSILIVCYELFIAIICLNRPIYVDEVHFVKTIRFFGEGLNVAKLTWYSEMSGPMPFLLYAMWGKVAGFTLPALRVFSLILAAVTFLSFHFIMFKLFKNGTVSLLTTLFYMANPYIIGLSVFVYTDMSTILFLLLGVYAIIRRNAVMYGLCALCMLLCRQYCAFFIVGAGMFFLLEIVFAPDKRVSAIRLSIANMLACLPLAWLMWLWKGTAPAGEIRSVYLVEPLHFHPGFLTIYISMIFVYALPYFVWFWRTIYRSRAVLIAAALLSPLYFVFPIKPWPAIMLPGLHSYGFYHKVIYSLWGYGFMEQLFLYIPFLVCLPFCIRIILDVVKKIGARSIDFTVFVDSVIFAFLAVMPFSFWYWEKYLLPLIPLIIVRFILLRREPHADAFG
jgi:hypothetical protein